MKELDKSILKSLQSNNTKEVVDTLVQIKKDGKNSYLPYLFDLLNSTDDADIRKETLALLNTVKSDNAQSYFIEAIGNNQYEKIRKDLLAACWQNSLDFEDYLPFFVHIIIEEDFEIAFEAFTIIDNFEYLPGKNAKEETLAIIANQSSNLSEQKQYFLQEIQKMLS